MEYLNISRIAETDFDRIIEKIGGQRVTLDSSKETKLNCDYRLDNALIELKLVEEEPAYKKSKQQKLAELFNNAGKTKIIDPFILSVTDSNRYYRILETPIKTALKKSSKQLKQTSSFISCDSRITIIINNGLSLMSPDEFKSVAIKCAKNDTSGIDILLIGGCYYYSDKYDMVTILSLEEINLRNENSSIVEKIQNGWNDFIFEYMNRNLMDLQVKRDKKPLQDISFTIGDQLYVKPPPKWGKKSSFWPNGKRPREDSTGLKTCPTLAKILPKFDINTYDHAKSLISDNWRLKTNLKEYLQWANEEIRKNSDIMCPTIAVNIPQTSLKTGTFFDCCKCAVEIFEGKIHKILKNAKEYTEYHQSLNYILLTCIQIGIDEANDTSWISHEQEMPGLDKSTNFIDGERIKFEYALHIAATYCIKRDANCVYFEKNETYKWV